MLKDLWAKTKGKKVWKLVVLLGLGISLMYMGTVLDKKPDEDGAQTDKYSIFTGNSALNKQPEEISPELTKDITSTEDYEAFLEHKLEETLSKAEGVGKVSTIITLSYEGEVALAEDTVYETTRTGENSTEKREVRHVLAQGKDGVNQPIIIKKVKPKIEGAVIVAEGGDNPAIKAQLTKAAGALLNLPAHKIEVLKMREE